MSAPAPPASAPTVPARLRHHAADRTAASRRFAADGGAVVGCVGADVPVELVTAAGLLPVRLSGTPGTPTPRADRYLGTGVDPATRSVLETLLSGGHGPVDLLVVSSDCEGSRRLFYAVRELHRLRRASALPPVRLVDVLHKPHRTTTEYVRTQVRGLRSWLAAHAGRRVGDDDLAEAIARHDRLRASLSRMRTLRRREPCGLSGTDALAVVAASTAMPVREATDLVDELVTEVERSPSPECSGLRTYLTGSGHDTPAVYAALEAAGLCVVGEDHDWGDRLHERRVEGSDELALAERYQDNGPAAASASIRRRASHTASAAAASGAHVLLGYARAHDPAPPWDFPHQRAETGLPAALLRDQPYGGVHEADLEAAVAALTTSAGAPE